jgi:hypothetical protein
LERLLEILERLLAKGLLEGLLAKRSIGNSKDQLAIQKINRQFKRSIQKGSIGSE